MRGLMRARARALAHTIDRKTETEAIPVAAAATTITNHYTNTRKPPPTSAAADSYARART